MEHKGVTMSETALEFFRVAFENAMARERMSVGPLTECYVVNLLVGQVHGGIDPDGTLADRFAAALTAVRAEKVRLLREIGDAALVTCGLWADRELRPRHPMDARYQATLGRMAYSRLGGLHRVSLDSGEPDVFVELADRFTDLVDALIRLGTQHSLSTARDVLRLYEQWEKTHSRHAARALAEQGIMVSAFLDVGAAS